MRDFAKIPIRPIFELLNDYNKNKPKEEQIWLDANDMVIFDYIAQFCLSDNEKIKQNRIVIDGVEYTQIAYKKILDDNPILPFESKRNLIRSLEKLEYVNLIKKILDKKNGNKTYFTLGQLSQYLLTNLSIGYRQKSHNPIDKNVKSLTTNLSHNRDINIENNDRDKKIENLYIGTHTDFEKKLLRVIFNLQDLFEKHNLKAYKDEIYFNTYRELLKQGYTEEQLLNAIYSRVYKVFNDDVDKHKHLETLSNPNYFKNSITQLVIEAKFTIDKIKDFSLRDEEEIIDEYLPNLFIRYCYYEEYEEYISLLDLALVDVEDNEYPLEEIEYHIFLISKFLAKYELNVFDGFRRSILKNAKEHIPYINLIKRILYSLIYFEDNEDFDLLEDYTELSRMVDLYNERLNKLEINLSLEEIIQELENRIPLN